VRSVPIADKPVPFAPIAEGHLKVLVQANSRTNRERDEMCRSVVAPPLPQE
jgi:hypothetical protein